MGRTTHEAHRGGLTLTGRAHGTFRSYAHFNQLDKDFGMPVLPSCITILQIRLKGGLRSRLSPCGRWRGGASGEKRFNLVKPSISSWHVSTVLFSSSRPPSGVHVCPQWLIHEDVSSRVMWEGAASTIAAIGRPSALGHLSGPDGKRDLHRLEADGKSWSKVMLSFQDPQGLLLNKLRREFGRCQQQSWSCIRSLDQNTAVIRRPSCLTH